MKKNRIKWAAWALAVAAGFTAGMQASAADTNTNKWYSSGATSSHQTLGTVERANKIIGREVRNSSNQKIGKIDDLAVDLESGRVIYAVLSVGGFLGVGDRLVAVPPNAMTEQGKEFRLDADKEKLMQAPQLSKDSDKQSQYFTPSFASEVYKYFGQSNPWFESASGATGQQFGNVHRASDLIGMDVRNTANEKIGDIDNVVIDWRAARAPYVVLSPDRNLNLGNNLYALPPNALTASSDNKSLATGISREKLASAPHFNKSEWPDMASRSWALQVYQYYGKQPYFETLQPTSDRSSPQLYHEPEQKNK